MEQKKFGRFEWKIYKETLSGKQKTNNIVLVIRRMVDKNKSYTAIFLKGEPPNIFPTTDYEHARILQIYKQDKKYDGILNDFTDIDLVE